MTGKKIYGTPQEAREASRLRSQKQSGYKTQSIQVLQWLYPFFVRHAREMNLSNEEIDYLETTVKPTYQKIKLYGVKKIDWRLWLEITQIKSECR